MTHHNTVVNHSPDYSNHIIFVNVLSLKAVELLSEYRLIGWVLFSSLPPAGVSVCTHFVAKTVIDVQLSKSWP